MEETKEKESLSQTSIKVIDTFIDAIKEKIQGLKELDNLNKQYFKTLPMSVKKS